MRKGDVDLWARDEVHFQQHGSRCRMCGFRRSQGSGSLACSDAQKCRVFRSRAPAGWAFCVSRGDRQIQWA